MEPFVEFSERESYFLRFDFCDHIRITGQEVWDMGAQGQLGDEGSGCCQDLSKLKLHVSCWRLWLGTDNLHRLRASLQPLVLCFTFMDSYPFQDMG